MLLLVLSNVGIQTELPKGDFKKKKKKVLWLFSAMLATKSHLKVTEDDAFELRFCKVLWVWDSGASWETDSEGRGGKKQPVAHCMSPVICRTVWVYLPQGWFNCF